MRAKAARFFSLIKFLFKIQRGSIIIFLFPVYARMNQLLLKMLAFKKGVKIICMIGDIEGLRDRNEDVVANEKKQFKAYRYFIVHNTKMEEWIKYLVPQSRVVKIDFLII